MRIIVCTKRDLHGCIFLNQLMPRLAGHALQVLLSDKVRPAELEIPALAEMSWLERGLPVDRLFPRLDAMGEANDAQWQTFAGLERRHGLPCQVVADINSPETLALLRGFEPDLIVSARFSHIFKPPAIATARYGVVNVHPGALPAYAGLFAPMRTIAEGGRELVCCLHVIDPGIDSGPIIATERLPYREEDGLLAQIADIYPRAIPHLLDIVERCGRGAAIEATPQDRQQRRYRSLPDATEVAAFLAAGHRLYTEESYLRLLARFCPPGLPLTIAGLNRP